MVSSTPRLLGSVDPGKTGAIGIYDLTNLMPLSVIDTPVDPTGDIDALEFWQHITGWLPAERSSMVIERVSAIKGAGAGATFMFGRSFGIAEGLAQAGGYPLYYLRPRQWKKIMGLPVGATKDDSRALAMQLWPAWKDSFKRKRDDGRAEALLIAEAARREFSL